MQPKNLLIIDLSADYFTQLTDCFVHSRKNANTLLYLRSFFRYLYFTWVLIYNFWLLSKSEHKYQNFLLLVTLVCKMKQRRKKA